MLHAPEVVARLRQAYASEADPKRAVGAAAYLRHQFAFFGLRAADRRRLTAAALAGMPPPADAVTSPPLSAPSGPSRSVSSSTPAPTTCGPTSASPGRTLSTSCTNW